MNESLSAAVGSVGVHLTRCDSGSIEMTRLRYVLPPATTTITSPSLSPATEATVADEESGDGPTTCELYGIVNSGPQLSDALAADGTLAMATAVRIAIRKRDTTTDGRAV